MSDGLAVKVAAIEAVLRADPMWKRCVPHSKEGTIVNRDPLVVSKGGTWFDRWRDHIEDLEKSGDMEAVQHELELAKFLFQPQKERIA